MNEMWEILGIQPTRDTQEIRAAYAKKSRGCNPEEDPQGFMALRRAYQEALAWAAGEEQESPQPPTDAPSQEPQQEIQFIFGQQENTYRQGDAFQRFIKLYTPQNQKNWKLWLEYFTSQEFLRICYEEDFCTLLLEHIQAHLSDIRPGQGFIQGLYAAYDLDEISQPINAPRQFRCHAGQSWTCPGPIAQLIDLLPTCRRLNGEELSILTSFREYHALWDIDHGPGWNDQGLSTLRQILERYTITCIWDKIPSPSFGDPTAGNAARHPLSIRLLTDFFSTAALPEEAFRMLWDILDLKNAQMGRPAVVYGPLRKACLARYPQLEHQARKDFSSIKKAFWDVRAYDPASIDAFFALPELEEALFDRTFVERDLLVYWNLREQSKALLDHLSAFYAAHPQAPFAQRVIDTCDDILRHRDLALLRREDDEAPADPRKLELTYRPLLRHWLNTAFPRFDDLNQFLDEDFPLSPVWSDRLFGLSDKTVLHPEPIPLPRMLGPVEILLHRHYIEYRANGEEIFTPGIPFQQLSLFGRDALWLLPLALVAPGEEDEVHGQITVLLSDTAVLPQSLVSPVADALTDELFYWNTAEDPQPLPIFRENALDLWGAELALYFPKNEEGGPDSEEPPILVGRLLRVDPASDAGPSYLPDLLGPFPDWAEGQAQCIQLLEKAVDAPPLTYGGEGHEGRRFPDLIYSTPFPSTGTVTEWAPPAEILNQLWWALDGWASMYRIPQRISDHFEDLRRQYRTWRNSIGRSVPLTEQLKALCQGLGMESAEEFIGPGSPAFWLMKVIDFVEATAMQPEEVRIPTLLSSPFWEQIPASALAEVEPPPLLKDTAPLSQQEEETALLERLDPLLMALWVQVYQLRQRYTASLDKLLSDFAEGSLSRLQMSYAPEPTALAPGQQGQESLVFLRDFTDDGALISCMYFDDVHNTCYLLCRKPIPGSYPEAFTPDDPFPQDGLFRSFLMLQMCLSDVLTSVTKNRHCRTMELEGPFEWREISWALVPFADRPSRYLCLKDELGQFLMPEEWYESNSEDAAPAQDPHSLVLDIFLHKPTEELPPALLTMWETWPGSPISVPLDTVCCPMFAKAMEQFWAGEICQLRLVWEVEKAQYMQLRGVYQSCLKQLGSAPALCSLVLMRDEQGQMMMVLLDDFLQRAEYRVADVRTFMDIESKYPKTPFRGKPAAAYLIHTDPLALKKYINDLMATMDFPYEVTREFACYTSEKPTKCRSYEQIRRELLADLTEG